MHYSLQHLNKIHKIQKKKGEREGLQNEALLSHHLLSILSLLTLPILHRGKALPDRPHQFKKGFIYIHSLFCTCFNKLAIERLGEFLALREGDLTKMREIGFVAN